MKLLDTNFDRKSHNLIIFPDELIYRFFPEQ